MGGKRQKGIGMNKARKKKVSFAIAVPELPESDGDDDAGEDDDPPPPPAPKPTPAPEPNPTPSASSDLPAGSEFQSVLEDAHARSIKAKKNYDKIKRCWQRKMSYINGREDAHSHWRSDSEVRRDIERLFSADSELWVAHAEWAVLHCRWVRMRSVYVLSLRHAASPEDQALERFYKRALKRALGMGNVCMEPMIKHLQPHTNIWDFLAKHFGLALTYGLVYSDAPGLQRSPK